MFCLNVEKIEQVCRFELLWGQGQRLVVMVSYPDSLTHLYREWQRVYLSFYKTTQMPLPSIVTEPVATEQDDALRGRTIDAGNLTLPTTDWHTRLVEAETRLLNEFHRWLRSAELFDIRATIARTGHAQIAAAAQNITVSLTCTPLELARFPWEAWEISTDFASTRNTRIVRSPANIPAPAVTRKRQGRTRILAILGDDTGLNFQADREAVKSLARMADIHFVGWQPGQTPHAVKTQIQQAIAHDEGWDVLFFAGHSNENPIAGGELAIAPGVSLLIHEIAPQLTHAKERGLQFALFNSCNGLNIAESLIALGFGQVAVMREPIHNRVAQEFLLRFLQSLATYQNVQESIEAACQFLRMERNLTYPSAYLVPSLFCHPGAELFQIPPVGWKRQLRQVIPTRLEAIALATCLALSVIPPVQNFLLDGRIWTQAVYRDVTRQVPPVGSPPVVLVQIDAESIRRDSRIAKPNPMDRSYLADLVNQLAALNAKIVGIDYLLDRADPTAGNDALLGQAIRSAVAKHGTWFVFGSLFDLEDRNITEERAIASQNWSLQGYTESFPTRITLPYPTEDCRQTCPFGYLLSLIYQANQTAAAGLPKPQVSSTANLRTQLLNFVDREAIHNPQLGFLERSHLTPVSAWSYDQLGLVWLEPMIDFSIPPDRIYTRIAAWRLLEHPLDLPQLSQQIVIIGSGGYTEAKDVTPGQQDYHPVPAAVSYWQTRLPPDNQAAAFPNQKTLNSPVYLPVFTGAEVHAYTLHHLLNRRLVVPVPDLWMAAIAVLLGRGVVLLLKHHQHQQQWTSKRKVQSIVACVSAIAIYGAIGLQLYVSAAILLPWILPSSVFWVYVLPTLRKNTNV